MVRKGLSWMALLTLPMLAGCGGGGGVNSTPAPPVATPTPTASNTSITDLRVDQTFSTNATTTNTVLQVPSSTVTSTSQQRGTLDISYDSASRSYTVRSDGRTQTFGPNDVASNAQGEVRYVKSATREFLTLVTTPLYVPGAGSNRYVGLGYYQQNSGADGTQSTRFDTFTYGLNSPESAVPRTGSAQWTTDVFGLVTTPGQPLRSAQGAGAFDVDFSSAAFTASARLMESNVVDGASGGGFRFQASGTLGSGATFAGRATYDGQFGGLGGTITGQFYGPAAEEVGASFAVAGGQAGSVLTGALTGQRNGNTPASLTLLNVLSEQRFASTLAQVSTQRREDTPGRLTVSARQGNRGLVVVGTGGPISVASPDYVVREADRVSDGRSNFTTYRTTQADGKAIEVAFYRPGSANSEIALTYLSLATWTARQAKTLQGQRIEDFERTYLPYGFRTPSELVMGRTGSASYSGVVIATGASGAGDFYDVGGTSRFDVDFSNARYTGSLSLVGTSSSGTRRDFGSFGFGGIVANGGLARTTFNSGRPDDAFFAIDPIFFGTDAQEIGATFNLSTGPASDIATVQIGGVALAKRP